MGRPTSLLAVNGVKRFEFQLLLLAFIRFLRPQINQKNPLAVMSQILISRDRFALYPEALLTSLLKFFQKDRLKS